MSERRAQAIKLAIARNTNHDLAVAGRQRAVRSEGFVPRALRLRIDTCELPVREMVGHEHDAGLKKRCVHALAFSGSLALHQRSQNAERHPGAGGHIQDGDAGTHRLPFTGASDAHDAGARLQNRVVTGLGVIGSTGAIGRERSVNNVWLRGANGRFIQTQLGGFAPAEIFEKDITSGRQSQHRRASLGF
jgi:hypothetical protein